jgi:serine/threonine protein kinase
LNEKRYFHSDIKPENIQLVRSQDGEYILKLIDLGSLKKETLEYQKHTPEFFDSP